MDMSLGEILKIAGIDTVLGMGTVFAVLILISLFIWLLGVLFKQEDPALAKAAAAASAPAAPASSASSSDSAADAELAAVITAAIHQFVKNQYGEEIDEDQYIVRNIRRATWKHTL